MDPLHIFIPLAKADATERLVFGSFDETPDRAGEICDYATAKPAFEAWSAELQKASDGKSLGNIRGQHSNIAAGRLVELTFDDDLKKIGFVAHIVDDNEWRKVEAGVYTGFSPGGRYAKRWQDGRYKRYTPDVRELSIVDVPCNPTATFTMVKADGSEEQRDFAVDKAYEPGNEATLARADELAKAAGKPGKGKDFVVKARAELIAENADEALLKMAGDIEPETPPADEPKAADPVAALDAAMAKADGVLAGPDAAGENLFADLNKVADALNCFAVPMLTKSLWSTEWLNRLLRDFASLQSEVTWDAKYGDPGNEADMSIPAQAAKIVAAIGDLLITMTQEGVADLLTGIEASGVEIDAIVTDGDGEAMELANRIIDLVKADSDLMEKAGARNSKADAKMIQTIHDHAISLGAACGDEVAKDAMAALSQDRDRLAKAVETAAPKIEELAATVETQRAELAARDDELQKAHARVAELEALPAPAKGHVRAIDKAADSDLTKSDATTTDHQDEDILTRAQRARFKS
jgi:hypothetical protein